jgi:hypothetical protein
METTWSSISDLLTSLHRQDTADSRAFPGVYWPYLENSSGSYSKGLYASWCRTPRGHYTKGRGDSQQERGAAVVSCPGLGAANSVYGTHVSFTDIGVYPMPIPPGIRCSRLCITHKRCHALLATFMNWPMSILEVRAGGGESLTGHFPAPFQCCNPYRYCEKRGVRTNVAPSCALNCIMCLRCHVLLTCIRAEPQQSFDSHRDHARNRFFHRLEYLK